MPDPDRLRDNQSDTETTDNITYAIYDGSRAGG